MRAAIGDCLWVCPSVKPIGGGKSLNGPSDKMLRKLGLQPSAATIAKLYSDLCTGFVLDTEDIGQT